MYSYKIIYICFHDLSKLKSLGVKKKVKGQIEGFEQNGVKVDLCTIREESVLLNEKTIGRVSHLQNKVKKQFKNHSFFRIISKIDFSAYRFIYFRYTLLTSSVFRFIKQVGTRNTLLIEYPNYPYDKNYKTLHHRLLLSIDKFYRNKLFLYVDGSINYTGYKKIHKRPSLFITNGITLHDYPKLPPKMARHSVDKIKQLSLIAVANINFWHGFDRIIDGLINYYKSHPDIDVIFHIVGESSVCNLLEKRVEDQGLEKWIKFHGFLKGKKLQRLYDKSDAGVGAIGVHRVDMKKTSALKLKEYALQGLPVIAQGTEDDFEGTNFYYKVSYDDSPINIRKFIKFLINGNFVRKEIQNYALANFGWKPRIKQILEFAEEIRYAK